MVRVQINPKLIRWACKRAATDVNALKTRFPKIDEWMRNESQPTFKQVEALAKATHTAFGFFMLDEPPVEKTPIPDLRTMGSKKLDGPSANLLDTIYLCQRRQDWYQEYAARMGQGPLRFVGSFELDEDEIKAASAIRSALLLDTAPLPQGTDIAGTIRELIARADELGILVMINGIVGNNTHRALNPEEFRGFALVDEIAPLVFVNGADTKAAQLFTLIHELAHLWLGESGVSDVTSVSRTGAKIEQWCNAVAAEVLAPIEVFDRVLNRRADIDSEANRLAKYFHVSTLVILRRMKDAGRLSADEHAKAYKREVARLTAIISAQRDKDSSGGDFYRTAKYRLSTRFASAVISSAKEGSSTFTEAFRLLGCRNLETFEAMAASFGLN